jgi:ankyrin repeat protein
MNRDDLDIELFNEINKNSPDKNNIYKLISLGANINAKNSFGDSLLQCAIENIQDQIKTDENGHYTDDGWDFIKMYDKTHNKVNLKIIQWLLEFGSDPNIINFYDSCLNNAIDCYNPELIKLLLLNGANQNWVYFEESETGESVLDYAYGEKYELIEWYNAKEDSLIIKQLDKIINILINYGAKTAKELIKQ